jgi:hypothetical protein
MFSLTYFLGSLGEFERLVCSHLSEFMKNPNPTFTPLSPPFSNLSKQSSEKIALVLHTKMLSLSSIQTSDKVI